MLSFNFGGKDSYKDYGIIIAKRPTLPSPKRRVSYVDVPGRDSSFRYDEGTYEDITIVVECTVKGNKLAEKLDNIKSWLLGTGEGELIFSFQDDKKYTAQVVNSIDFKQVFKYTSVFPIIFNCRPFKYSVSNTPVNVTIGTGTTIINNGSMISKPLIKVYCVGDGSFKINSQEVLLSNIRSNYVILDSEVEEAYTDKNGTLINMNNSISGEIPILDIGSNVITYKGGVTKLEITPNWRWL